MVRRWSELSIMLHVLLLQSGFLDDIFYDVSVIKCNSQLLCHLSSDGSSAAAKLSSDCNHALLHRITSL